MGRVELLQEKHDLLKDFLRTERICHDVEVGVLAGVAKPVVLFLVVSNRPVHFPALFRYQEGHIQKDQYVRISYALPHVWHIRMFLGDVVSVYAGGMKHLGQR